MLILNSLVALNSGGYTHAWSSAYILCTLLFGLSLIAAWIVWEWKFAPYPMVPGELFKGQRIVGLAYVVAFAAGMNFFRCVVHQKSTRLQLTPAQHPQLLPRHIHFRL